MVVQYFMHNCKWLKISSAWECVLLAITESLEVIPNHHILPWLATITWPWHSFLRVFFKIASIGLTQNFHILTHQNITIYWFCQKEEGKKLICYCYCYADFLRKNLSVECLSYCTQIKRHHVNSRKKNHNKKILGRLKTCGVIFFFHWRLNLKKVA